MHRVPEENAETSRPVAEAANPKDSAVREREEPTRRADATVKNADRPKGIDKDDGQLESLNDDLQRVEKRNTM